MAAADIETFALEPGRVIGGKYVVEARLGAGWEGEVYKVIERTTGAVRAVKIFFPRRNERGVRLRRYAQKLEKLRRCAIVIKYHHSEALRIGKQQLPCLVSEFVEGELLGDFVNRQPGHRLDAFRAMHVLHSLAAGLAEVHAEGEYHGDLHAGNVLVSPRGIGHVVKILDFFHWGGSTPANRRDDIVDVIHLFHAILGGRERYARQPREVKAIGKGLRRDLILGAFPSMLDLKQHLESFEWSTPGSPAAVRDRSRHLLARGR